MVLRSAPCSIMRNVGFLGKYWESCGGWGMTYICLLLFMAMAKEFESYSTLFARKKIVCPNGCSEN